MPCSLAQQGAAAAGADESSFAAAAAAAGAFAATNAAAADPRACLKPSLPADYACSLDVGQQSQI